jgi:hypothetical protein
MRNAEIPFDGEGGGLKQSLSCAFRCTHFSSHLHLAVCTLCDIMYDPLQ